jgi:hypothetical protein
MKRLALYAVLVAAALVPATTGLLANASFSQEVPVRTPPQAQLLVDDGPSATSSATPTTSPSPSATTRHAEPGDDHGGDRDRTTTRTDEPGDDHGGDRDRGSDDRGSDDGSHSGKGSGDSGSDD